MNDVPYTQQNRIKSKFITKTNFIGFSVPVFDVEIPENHNQSEGNFDNVSTLKRRNFVYKIDIFRVYLYKNNNNKQICVLQNVEVYIVIFRVLCYVVLEKLTNCILVDMKSYS